jgi:hypothetical protein
MLPDMGYKESKANSTVFFLANSDKPSEVEGFPQREWWIEVYIVNDKGDLVQANLFDKVVYHLHPSFGPRATQSKSVLLWWQSSLGWQRQRDLSCVSGRNIANCIRELQLSRTRLSVSKKKDGVNLTCRSSWWRTSRISSTTI